MRLRFLVLTLLAVSLGMAAAYVSYAWAPLTVADDPLVRMPGTQPGQVILEAPRRCLNCHGGYNSSVEPFYNWQGGMMSQAARDFLFWSAMTVAGQDSIWAVGRPNAMDICERCHFPQGWLEGRSDPHNASAMTAADYDGVHCDVCHAMYDPFYQATYARAREGDLDGNGQISADEWRDYWDETNASATPSDEAALLTYTADQALAQTTTFFHGGAFYTGNEPPVGYTENGAGQYFASGDAAKRASFADASLRHTGFYSRYHKSRYACGACHDVSNPVLENLAYADLVPGDGSTVLPTETRPAYAYYHVERTFSEFMLSAYGQEGGAAGLGPFAPDQYETSYASNYIAKCQDCHLRDVTGKASSMNDAVLRPTNSTEHPNSGQPLHDMTGGNVWVSWVLASTVPGSAGHDAVNQALLNNPAGLTLDLTQGLGINASALLAGVARARQQLELAASIEGLTWTDDNLYFRIQNQTGHKLISGFPEGRRMFVNIRAYDAGSNLIYEVNPYDELAGTLVGLDYDYLPDPDITIPDPATGLPFTVPLPEGIDAATEAYVDELVYEMHTSSELTGEDESFHFALATDRYKDNRIPSKGFRIDDAATRLVQPRWHGQDAAGYFGPSEYQGGYDEVNTSEFPQITFPASAVSFEVNLYYQTTSREYIEFLRDEINGQGERSFYGPDNPTDEGSHTLAYSLGLNPDDDNAYLIQTDPFFAGLADWGDTIWKLWKRNMTRAGASPLRMAQGTLGAAGSACGAPGPSLLAGQSGHKEIILTWSAEHEALAGDPEIIGYNIYYDQAGKAQWRATTSLETSYTDAPLTDGDQYCYRVTSCYIGCESAMSEPLCATAGDVPTAVELSTFSARRQEGAILVAWQTASEVDNLGFHLYRAVAPSSRRPGQPQEPPVKINPALIVSTADLAGAAYQFLDRDAAPGTAYLYWLQAVDVHGDTEWHGPVRAADTARTPFGRSSGIYRWDR